MLSRVEDGLSPWASQDPTTILRRLGVAGPTTGLESVWTRRQRHETALVSGDGQHWFIKRPGPPLAQGPVCLAGEIAFHRLLASGALPAGLADHIPRVDAASGSVLVCEGLPDHAPVTLDAGRDSFGIADIAGQVGQVLAMTHSMRASSPMGDIGIATSPVMTYGHVSPETVGRAPQGFEDLIRLVQADPTFNTRMRTLHARWTPCCLTHGDVKLDNILVPSGAIPSPRAMVVDWELAAVGDPLWDCGSFIGSLYHQATERLELHGESQAYGRDGARVTSAVHTFWNHYATTRKQHGWPAAEHDFDLALAWGGYWIVQRVRLLLPLRPELDAHDIAALHLATTLLEGVEAAGQEGRWSDAPL